MQPSKSPVRHPAAAGFTLPAILVVVGALLIIAVASLLIVGIERNTSRAFSDRERANLAVRAGLEDVKGIFAKETTNDDFLILQGTEIKASTATKDPAPYLYLARGSGGGDKISYRYVPLFSTEAAPATPAAGSSIKPPVGTDLVKAFSKEMTTLPWNDPAKVSWIEVPNEKGRIVARYAYWVEDLQSRVDAGTAGNTKDNGAHKRYGWTANDTAPTKEFPAPGLNAEASNPGDDGRDREPPLDQVALYALDPVSGAKDESSLDKTIIDSRKMLISPDSLLAVAGVVPPLVRGTDGNLADAKANSVERNLNSAVQPYDEQPVVPFAFGMDASVTGKPKLNLNALLAKSTDTAVDEMSAWIKRGLPTFETRKGGFPEDYLKTLAASALGYASDGNKPVVQMGTYRGLGASPMVSEIVMNIHYLGFITRNGNKLMQYQFVLYGEMFNHTNLPIDGNAALSYEVGLWLPGIGATPIDSIRFDDKALVSSSVQPPIEINLQNDRFWSINRRVTLQPGEYKFVRFATVNYQVNIGSGSVGANFTLTEKPGAAGLSMKWNDIEVERIPSIVRSATGLDFHALYRKYFGKAAIPGHSYGPYGEFINNMGDPRIAHFIRFQGIRPSSTNGAPLGENAFPGNISPNRRNIRLGSIYSASGDPNKLTSYGRVIPSEWPDGGHDAAVSTWTTGWNKTRQGNADERDGPPTNGTGPGFDPTSIPGGTLPQPGESITYLSNRKRYYSATELGRIYDPIMFLPTFDPSSGLNSERLRATGEPSDKAGFIPAAGAPWPLVQIANQPSPYFGGGNTLRIGRPEHPRFDQPTGHIPADMPPLHAARLLDLFHAGESRSSDKNLREGPVVRIEGHVNINTASRESLRAMAAGFLQMDPKLSKRTSDVFDSRMAPAIEPLTTVSAPTSSKEADTIADAIIRGRPYTSPSELACAMNPAGDEVFGNPFLYPYTPSGQSFTSQLQWSDAAAEEVFGRVYEASTVRSRNFRVWVIGQAIAPTTPGNLNPEILSEARRAFTIFANPGERTNGVIDPSKSRVTILHENDF